jgi:hypothetical protein
MYTSLKMAQTISDRIAEPTGLRTLLFHRLSGVRIRRSGRRRHSGGFQSHIRVGAVLRTSGSRFTEAVPATLDGTDKNGAASEGASFFDPSAEFHYKLPFEITGAIAWVGLEAR